MLHIIWGRAHAPHTRHLLDNMVARARSGMTNQILLVPEPFSHESERMLCELGGDAISMFCEVLTFKRMAHRVLSLEGGLAEPQLDAAGRLLLLSRALDTVRPHLTHWGITASAPRFLEQLLATIDELKVHEAKPDMLSALPDGHPSRSKLCDLRLIWEAFDALTAQAALDPRDLLSRVAALIDGGTYARGVQLYVDGFVSLTAQEYRVLSAFLRHGADTTVCVVGLPRGSGTEPCWEQPRLMAERLTRMAAGVGCPVTQAVLDGASGAYYAPMLRRVEANIMLDDPGPEQPEASGGAVILCEARDILAECEWAAQLVREWVDSGKLRYRDIAVAAPSWDAYGAMLESACLRYALPLFSDNTVPLTQKSVVRFLTSAMQAVLHGFTPDSVTALLKTGLTPLGNDGAFKLEDYLRTHGIKGAHWTSDKPWTAHPDGWGRRLFTERDTARLAEINQMRSYLRTHFTALRGAFLSERRASGHARALYSFCEALNLPGTLAENCERLERQGFDQQAEEGRQLWGFVCRALDNCADILGEQECAPELFEQLFTLCLTQYRVGVIPVALDRLHIGPIDRIRRRSLKRLILLGASDPFMPRRSEPPGLLTDEERVLLEEGGVSLSPGAEERASRELFTLYRCFSLPNEMLAVCRPLNIENVPAQPALFFSRLAALTGAPVTVAGPEPSGGDDGALWISDRTPLSPERTVLLTAPGYLSPTRAETYQTCPFRYFLRYGLSARARPFPGPQPADAGSMIHAVLEGMVRGMMEEADGLPAFKGEHAARRALAHAELAADRFTAGIPGEELRTARAARLLERLRRTALSAAADVCGELCRSDFEPLDAELRFTAALSDGSIPLRGVVDRLDGWRHDGKLYLRVVDYKSGHIKFSLGDILHGLGIQMLCYLFALDSWKGERAEPAGVLYLPAHDRFSQSKYTLPSDSDTRALLNARSKRDGLILDDQAVADAMENGEAKIYIPARYKNGAADARSKVASRERFELLRRHVGGVMESLSDGLRGGDVRAEPVRRNPRECACDLCDLRQACMFDERGEPCRYLTAPDRGDFWAALEKEADKGGN